MIGLKFLRSHALFGGLMDDELEMIITLLSEESFEAGDTIITEGESGDRLYFIVKGSVEILKQIPGSDEKRLIATLSAGDAFGEMELIDIQRRAATVNALEPTQTLTLSSMSLYKVQKWNLKTYTIIILNLARELSRRLRKMDDLLASSLFYNANHNSH